jgi:UDP-3-O-[3-hydroxymyristoyl] N-acetylglucosamine deacetylase
MAALAGLNIDNAMIEIDGPETPIMDGSAAQFVDAIDAVGLVSQSRRRRYIKIVKPIRVEQGRCRAELRPASSGLQVDVEIDFDASIIGRQRFALGLDPQKFRREISRARTFGFVADVKKLWQAGFALGSSLENSVALDGDSILNPEGLRYADEFVRHKALDAIGDLALAGLPMIGAYVALRPGHTLNRAMLAALFSERKAYEIVEGATRRMFAVSGSRIGASSMAAMAASTAD